MPCDQTIFSQLEFDIRCEWGEQGVAALAPNCDAVIIVDVLSFSTCVDVATARGALVHPYLWKDEAAASFARSIGAELAQAKRSSVTYSLSPQSLLHIPPRTQLVLPSPNGATLTLRAERALTVTGCLRNCRAVALAVQKIGRRIGIIPAGERWQDQSLRPAWEDWIGAGAIIRHLPGTLSLEARSALTAFSEAQEEIFAYLKQCGSGKELIARGFEEDVVLAAAMNVSNAVPVYKNGVYVRLNT